MFAPKAGMGSFRSRIVWRPGIQGHDPGAESGFLKEGGLHLSWDHASIKNGA
jgi:hypothetical protein